MNKTDVSDLEKLQYLQVKIHETVLNCVNTYILAEQKDSLFYTFLASVFMRFRDSVDTSISNPARLKASKSVIDNIEKEILKKLDKKLPKNCTLEDIDKISSRIVQDVCKDYLGTTLVFNTKNNCSRYCEHSKKAKVNKLYKALLATEAYLRSDKKFHKNILLSDSSNQNYFNEIDISDTFVDKNPNPEAPRKVKPLNLKNIDTLQKYYDTKIALLTLLTNHSIPCTESTDGKKHKYCISELDVPYLQLVKQTMQLHPQTNDEAIKDLIKRAHQNYFKEYLPFDEQLEKAIKEQKFAKKSSNYTKKFSNMDKKKYTQELINLKNNLKQLKNDRLLNCILTIELKHIFEDLSKQPNLDVKIKSHKERAKSSGFYSTYYTIELNGILVCEVLGCSEFRNNLTKEGPASHNTMYKKSFNVRPLIELRENHFKDPKQAQKELDFYCEFLSTVRCNDDDGYHITKEDQKALKYLNNLVNYATSKLKVKDYITIQNGNHTYQMPIFDYITSLIDYEGAKFSTIYAAHGIEHNQSIWIPRDRPYSLENILKSRIGLSTLANMVKEKYIEIATLEKHDRLLANSHVRTYSSATTSKYYLPVDNLIAKNAEENYHPLDVKFHPMGQYNDER